MLRVVAIARAPSPESFRLQAMGFSAHVFPTLQPLGCIQGPQNSLSSLVVWYVLEFCVSLYLSVCLSVCLLVCLSADLPACVPACLLSVCLSCLCVGVCGAQRFRAASLAKP